MLPSGHYIMSPWEGGGEGGKGGGWGGSLVLFGQAVALIAFGGGSADCSGAGPGPAEEADKSSLSKRPAGKMGKQS